jgi:Tol biopolymer transport system component
VTAVAGMLRWRRLVVAACVVLAGVAPAGAALSTTAAPTGRIVFHKEGPRYGDAQLFTIRPDGTGLRQITHGPTSWVNADWSPDGRTPAFPHYLPDRAPVSLMNADGTNLLEVRPEGNQDAPSFTPDGKSRIYSSPDIERGIDWRKRP